jgi:hypothetical protein
MIKDHPDWSDRAIGRNCGLDHKTVGKLRQPDPEPDGVRDGEVPHGDALRQPHRDEETFDYLLDESPTTIAGYAEAVEEAATPAISKPDLGGGVSHPARFSNAILDQLVVLLGRHLEAGSWILDPFAGTGRIHEINEWVVEPYEISAIEIEPEWANLHPDTRVGNALRTTYTDGAIDGYVTSPCYGNRLADHHHASDPESRRSYTHDLGRDLSPDNAGALQWGPEYRDFHERAWKEATRVLRPGGVFVLNIKDHTRDGVRQHVAGWHVTTLCRLGFTLLEHVEVETPSLRVGENREGRWPEQIYVLRLGEGAGG